MQNRVPLPFFVGQTQQVYQSLCLTRFVPSTVYLLSCAYHCPGDPPFLKNFLFCWHFWVLASTQELRPTSVLLAATSWRSIPPKQLGDDRSETQPLLDEFRQLAFSGCWASTEETVASGSCRCAFLDDGGLVAHLCGRRAVTLSSLLQVLRPGMRFLLPKQQKRGPLLTRC